MIHCEHEEGRNGTDRLEHSFLAFVDAFQSQDRSYHYLLKEGLAQLSLFLCRKIYPSIVKIFFGPTTSVKCTDDFTNLLITFKVVVQNSFVVIFAKFEVRRMIEQFLYLAAVLHDVSLRFFVLLGINVKAIEVLVIKTNSQG